MLEPFRVTIDIRTDDLDLNGHVRGPAYLAYADHARWECMWAAGVDPLALKAGNLGPVNLETTIRFRRELRARARIDVLTRFTWEPGKVSRVVQEFVSPDGAVVAEVESLSGLLDLERRRLVPDPGLHWRKYAVRPEILGLP
ncbi:thioesterase [Amycolatopsis sp. WAC 01375]|uniref:acyl-CoA thioesterase n=1 Tax=Amycolatopsis sp. WAC 01375 TaxID=2203194 RepID=UPI000F78434B|nr:acyl-CoA thioesterase [Amycolatopsis sp. WAC 01375]RSM76551.1 thioesterase [Amycolatopsis sp. WAC 01375]